MFRSIHMRSPVARSKNPIDLGWLLDVTESRQPLSETSPIWVRRVTMQEGPATPVPERHPYCELSVTLEGQGISFVEGESILQKPGELKLLGPGLPHWGQIQQYPLHFITVYFLPSVLVEMGPKSDGVRILRRFTARQTLASRLVRPPRELSTQIKNLLEEMVEEFEQERFGREVRLRTLLLELLVSLLRWEQSQGRHIGGEELEVDWRAIMKTLQFLREHYSDAIYAREVARAAGVSESRLKVLFQKAIGISWVKYLQGYRIHRAAALLNEGDHNVTEAALAVGFVSFAHFNKIFRSFMGVSPKQYKDKGLSKQ
ncbi:MAG TPA: AraC family transcriptional regulator [Verrucomicrobiae bacterium]|jgi:AraC-like DNA-binding protein/quercetin dioxygenase-like cupin family protein|nr:AraC family transcriptional regulator [Verrucomicrobiae bacterium]